jgi:formylglycine-generating enzyme required for sulfatase activity
MTIRTSLANLLIVSALGACAAPAPTPVLGPPTPRPPTPTPWLQPAGQSGETRILNGIEMVYVPAGAFLMGSTQDEVNRVTENCIAGCDREWFEAELPVHTVTLDGFWVGKYEVTNAQYRQFVDAGGYADARWWSEEGWEWLQRSKRQQPAFWKNETWNGDNYPVVGITWYEADAFARWAGMRLPTEAEWEKAARGTDERLWPWGSEWDASRTNSEESNLQKTMPVGTYPAGTSPYGALDMAGNASEWCADWRVDDYYKVSPASNPAGPPSGTERVVRGGEFDAHRDWARCAARGWGAPYSYSIRVGFRVVAPTTPIPHGIGELYGRSMLRPYESMLRPYRKPRA